MYIYFAHRGASVFYIILFDLIVVMRSGIIYHPGHRVCWSGEHRTWRWRILQMKEAVLYKGAVNTTPHTISKVLLVRTHNCPTCLGDTRMSSWETKRKEKKRRRKIWALVLHNIQLCVEAGRGRWQWSPQCLQVILFIIQMKTLFYYPWGSRSNALMSLTSGPSFSPSWQPFTSQMMTKDRHRVAKKNPPGNYFTPTLL